MKNNYQIYPDHKKHLSECNRQSTSKNNNEGTVCASCNGSGWVKGKYHEPMKCTRCEGTGRI